MTALAHTPGEAPEIRQHVFIEIRKGMDLCIRLPEKRFLMNRTEMSLPTRGLEHMRVRTISSYQLSKCFVFECYCPRVLVWGCDQRARDILGESVCVHVCESVCVCVLVCVCT